MSDDAKVDAIRHSVIFTRAWAMPSPDTFSIPPIAEFVGRYLARATNVIDPFARNSRLAEWRNDLNPTTAAEYHEDAADFCTRLSHDGILSTLALFDPPYSPRQISECYQKIGRNVGMEGTQNGTLYRRTRDALLKCLAADAVVLSFGWNSAGMGTQRGFEIVEILLVAHGGAHNDTICVAEIRKQQCLSMQPPSARA